MPQTPSSEKFSAEHKDNSPNLTQSPSTLLWPSNSNHLSESDPSVMTEPYYVLCLPPTDGSGELCSNGVENALFIDPQSLSTSSPSTFSLLSPMPSLLETQNNTRADVPKQSFNRVTYRPNLFKEVQERLNSSLPVNWISFVDSSGIHVMLISWGNEKAIIRRIHFTSAGEVTISVHCQSISPYPYLIGVKKTELTEESIVDFVGEILKVVTAVRSMEICRGVDNPEYKCAWGAMPNGVIDRNPYQEIRYTETIRSVNCELLVSPSRTKCKQCTLLWKDVESKADCFKRNNFETVDLGIPNVNNEKVPKLEVPNGKSISNGECILGLPNFDETMKKAPGQNQVTGFTNDKEMTIILC